MARRNINQYVQMLTHGLAVNMGSKALSVEWVPKIIEMADALASAVDQKEEEIENEYSRKEINHG